MPLVQRGMTLVTPFENVRTLDIPSAIDLSPNAAIPLLSGELVVLDANNQAARLGGADGDQATNLAGGGLVVSTPGFCVDTERGRYDTQAIGKVSVLAVGSYIADFRVWDLGDNAALVRGTLVGFGTCSNDLGAGAAQLRTVLTTDAGLNVNAWRVGWVVRGPTNAGVVGSVLRVYITNTPFVVA